MIAGVYLCVYLKDPSITVCRSRALVIIQGKFQEILMYVIALKSYRITDLASI